MAHVLPPHPKYWSIHNNKTYERPHRPQNQMCRLRNLMRLARNGRHCAFEPDRVVQEDMSYPLPYPSSAGPSTSHQHQQPSHQNPFAHSLMHPHPHSRAPETSGGYPLDNDENGASQQQQQQQQQHPLHHHQHRQQHDHDPNSLNSHGQYQHPPHLLTKDVSGVIGDEAYYAQTHALPHRTDVDNCELAYPEPDEGDASMYASNEWMGVPGMHALPAVGAVEYGMNGGDGMCVGPEESLGLYLLGTANGSFGYH